jgi:hypothetical protein
MRSFCSARPARWRQPLASRCRAVSQCIFREMEPVSRGWRDARANPFVSLFATSLDSILTFRDILGQEDRFPAPSSFPSLSPLDSAPPSWYTYAQWLTSVLSMLQSAGPQLRRASSQRCGRATEHPGLSPIDPHPSCPVAPKRRAGRARRPSRPRAEWPLHAGVDLE